MHTIIIIINLNALLFGFHTAKTYFVLKCLFSLCLISSPIFWKSWCCFENYFQLSLFYQIKSKKKTETNTVLFMHPSISTTAFCCFVHLNFHSKCSSPAFSLSFSRSLCLCVYVALYAIATKKQTSLRIQSDVKQINSVHRCVSSAMACPWIRNSKRVLSFSLLPLSSSMVLLLLCSFFYMDFWYERVQLSTRIVVHFVSIRFVSFLHWYAGIFMWFAESVVRLKN